MKEGLKASAAATILTVLGHYSLKSFTPWYSTIPTPPKRILTAIIILGAFSAGSHLSQAYHVLSENRKMR